MLIICFGMGTTLRSASLYPDLHVDAVDIVPEVFECFPHFHAGVEPLLEDPRIALHVEDGRNYLLTRSHPYDIITIDPAPPLHSAGTVNLYTREFFELCRVRLTSGGLFCLWLPPAPETELKMIMRSFLSVFPDATLWGGLEVPGFYLIGGPTAIRMTSEWNSRLAERLSKITELGEWGEQFLNARYLRKLYLLDAEGIHRLVGDVPEITDDKPYTEFPLWRRLFRPEARQVFDADKVRQWLGELHR